jgi:hypothetical protein
MGLMEKLNDFKGPIVLIGLGVGAISVLDKLPVTIDFLGENTYLLYLGIIGISGFVYWKFHMSSKPKFARTVPSRDMTNPEYRKEIERQANNAKNQFIGDKSDYPTPSSKIFDEFNKED